MLEHTRNAWWKFHDSFHGSDTIVWARLQLLLGAIYTGMQSVDMTVFISDRHMLQYYIFANALITEMLRRRHEEDFK